ncbi:M42 family metallopeptidase [Arcicella rosea]|uniref:Putative aminopeptidase FrvX n=1 Tax=Arcicella rosea TaxID=502909 RepID=A0A841ESR4_9BACT|nr:M42 family metallopeptidase [Arcicella rosea]MBB6005364.1 putative aminopeptidase FrvX [Arcicella rosea]
MTENAKTFLYEYLNNASPTGFEASGQQIWLDYIKPYIDETIIDVYGTAVGVINPNQPYKVVIEAHADEISWFVNYIDDNGYIFVRRNGGSDAVIAPSMRCNLHTKKGVVKGVFGYPAIHVRDLAKDKAPTVNDIFIDLGAANKKEVEEMGVHVGTVVTFEDGLTELNNRYFVGRALDNRMGGFMIAEVARMLKENNVELPFTLYVVNAVQEEIGLRGAEMIVRRLKPDVAIVTDVTHDTQSPMYNKKEQGDLKCGSGPVICYGPAVQNNLRDFIIDVAEAKEIKIQRQAVSRSTGTDTDSFAYATEGVASALISLPLKYMHTTVETVSKEDVQAVINLIYESLLSLKGNEDWRYIK